MRALLILLMLTVIPANAGGVDVDKWLLKRNVDRITDKETVYAIIGTNNSNMHGKTGPFGASLAIICINGRPNAMVAFDPVFLFDKSNPIEYRFDNKNGQSFDHEPSEGDRRIARTVEFFDATAIIRGIQSSDTLYVRARSSFNIAEAEFPVSSGLDTVREFLSGCLK